VASLREGSLEFIIDRRASKDDGRGLEEAIMDMMPMTHKYKILLERRYEKMSFNLYNRLLNIICELYYDLFVTFVI
jgi:hypothetical protein